MKTTFLSLLLCVSLSACASDMKVTTVPVERIPLDIPQQLPLALKDVHFNVQVDAQGNVTYVLTGKDFDHLVNNTEQTQKYMNIQTEQLNACIQYNHQLIIH